MLPETCVYPDRRVEEIGRSTRRALSLAGGHPDNAFTSMGF